MHSGAALYYGCRCTFAGGARARGHVGVWKEMSGRIWACATLRSGAKAGGRKHTCHGYSEYSWGGRKHTCHGSTTAQAADDVVCEVKACNACRCGPYGAKARRELWERRLIH